MDQECDRCDCCENCRDDDWAAPRHRRDRVPRDPGQQGDFLDRLIASKVFWIFAGSAILYYVYGVGR